MFGLDMSAIRNVFTFHVCHCHLTAVRVQRKKTLMPLLHLSSCDIAAGPHPPASAFSPILSLPCWPFLLTDGSGPAGHHASRSCPAGHHRRSPRRFPRGGRDPQLPRTSIPPPSPPTAPSTSLPCRRCLPRVVGPSPAGLALPSSPHSSPTPPSLLPRRRQPPLRRSPAAAVSRMPPAHLQPAAREEGWRCGGAVDLGHRVGSGEGNGGGGL